MDAESTEYIAQTQPWRTGQGADKSALDPSWKPERIDCSGSIRRREGDGLWWWCDDCGYTGWGSFVKHKAPKHPGDLLHKSRAFFLERMRSQGMTARVSELQAQHLQAVVLRVAATLKPEELKQFIEEHVLPSGKL